MSPKIAVLLVALLVMSGCATSAQAADATWTQDEITYLRETLEPMANILGKIQGIVRRPKDGAAILEFNKSFTLFVEHPAPPATLAVIDYYVQRAIFHCGPASTSGTGIPDVDACYVDADTIQFELARLYAARGSYPPASQP
jgi:hypothetical protein